MGKFLSSLMQRYPHGAANGYCSSAEIAARFRASAGQEFVHETSNMLMHG